MQIDIISDTICPWCWIGKRRLAAALAERPVEDLAITWRAFQLNPDMPAEGMDRAAYLSVKFGGPSRARQIYDSIAEAGQSAGLEFRFDRIQRTPNSVDSHRLLRLAGRERAAEPVSEGLFQAYFVDGRDIGDLEVLAEVAAGAGMDPAAVRDFLEGEEDHEQVLAEDAAARRAGIQGVPCFIFNGRYALAGAQQPEVFHQMFDLARQDEAEATAAG